jgi:hypothetical protein
MGEPNRLSLFRATWVDRRRERRLAKGFDVAGAAERIGALGEEVGRVAVVIQRAAEGTKGSR